MGLLTSELNSATLSARQLFLTGNLIQSQRAAVWPGIKKGYLVLIGLMKCDLETEEEEEAGYRRIFNKVVRLGDGWFPRTCQLGLPVSTYGIERGSQVQCMCLFCLNLRTTFAALFHKKSQSTV